MRHRNQGSSEPISTGLALLKYGDLAATTRQRFLQMRPYLQQRQIEIVPSPLLDNTYLRALFSGHKMPKQYVARAYLRRLGQLLRAYRYDFLWIHCELFPYLPGLIERLAGLYGIPVIYDYDDAIFHQYDAHRSGLIRAVFGRKLVPLMKQAALVCGGNAYLTGYADAYCGNTAVVPTTVDTDVFIPAGSQLDTQQQVTIGWMGSPSTWGYVVPFLPMLEDLCRHYGAKLLVVGAQSQADTSREWLELRPWANESEVSDLQEMDIGIMPLPDEPWARGKSGYKLIQYMACGAPVVASPVAVNAEIVDHGVNGLHATTEADWRQALARLIQEAPLRRSMGQKGREKTITHYSLHSQGPRLAALLREAIDKTVQGR